MADDVAFRDTSQSVYSLLTDTTSILTSKSKAEPSSVVTANPLNVAPTDPESAVAADSPADAATAATAAPSPPETTSGQLWVAKICLMFMGLGVAISWTTMRAGIAYFSSNYELGAGVYTIMQICYNVPVLPLLIAQLSFDARYDSAFGSKLTYMIRITVALTILLACLLTVPHVGQTGLLVICVLVGVFDSTAYGAVCQFFALFPPSVGGFYFIGTSLTAPVSIGLSFATGFNSGSPSKGAVIAMFTSSAAFIVIGIIAAVMLLNSKAGNAYLAYKDRVAAASKAATEVVDFAGKKSEKRSSVTSSSEVGIVQILRETWLCHIALFICWWGTNWSGSLISYLPSQADEPGKPNSQFRLFLLYASLIGELIGKQLNIVRRGRIIKGPGMLLVGIVVRFSIILLYLLYLTQPLISGTSEFKVRIDGLAIAYLAIDSAAAAYFSTLTYGLAPAQLSNSSSRSRSSTLLSITLMLGLYLGLGCALGLGQKLSTIPR